MAEAETAMGGIGVMTEGGKSLDGIGRGWSRSRCKKGELNKQVIPFILRNVCILGLKVGCQSSSHLDEKLDAKERKRWEEKRGR